MLCVSPLFSLLQLSTSGGRGRRSESFRPTSIVPGIQLKQRDRDYRNDQTDGLFVDKERPTGNSLTGRISELERERGKARIIRKLFFVVTDILRVVRVTE